MRIVIRKDITLSSIVGYIAAKSCSLKIKEFEALSKASNSREKEKILINICDRFSTPLFFPKKLKEKEFFKAFQSKPLSFMEIAQSCQYLCSDKIRTEKGVFFTPSILAEEITERAFAHKKESILSVLDPACGSGVFLLASSKLLKERLKISSLKDIQKVLTETLYGADLDETSVNLTRILLLLSTFENFKDNGKELKSFNNSVIQGNSFEEIFKVNGFDIVLGNPPFGLSRNGCVSKAESLSMKERYKALGRGKVNQYLMFIARGYELLKDKGVLSFVTPNSWLGIKDGEMLRKSFLSKGEFHQLKILDSNTFKDASFEGVTFVIQKGVRCKNIKIERDVPKLVSLIEQKECFLNPNSVIPLSWNKDISKALLTIERDSLPLESPNFGFDPKIALQIYATEKGIPPQTSNIVESHAFHSDQIVGEFSKKYIEGRSLKRYALSWDGSYVEYGPWCAEYQPIDRFIQPRVLIREITGKSPYILNCSYIEREFLYNRSILHVLSKENDIFKKRQKLYSLLGILNSKVASFILLFRGQKSQRSLFPKVLNGDLKTFPIPNNFTKFASVFAPIVAKRLKTGDHLIDAEIDYFVLKAYGLPENMHEIVDSALNDLAFSSSRNHRLQSQVQQFKAA